MIFIVELPIPIFNKTNSAATEVEVRTVAISPIDEFIVLRGQFNLSIIGIFVGSAIVSAFVGSAIVSAFFAFRVLGAVSVVGSAILWIRSKNWEMHGLILTILVYDRNFAIRCPHSDGPVSADFRVGEVELNIDVDGVIWIESERMELVIALVEDSEVVVMRSLDTVELIILV